MKNKNTGLEYEKLTQLVFQQIVDTDVKVFQNIEVKHDVNITGITATHQIDVYWEFEVGGIVYRNIVQAKDWKNKVPQKEIMAFKAILDDMPIGTSGIYVCKSGYQSGAIDYAKAHGINIYELRDPKVEDWEGYIRTVNIDLVMEIPQFNNFQVILDEQWIDEHIPGINKDDLKRIGTKGSLSIEFFDSEYQQIELDKFLYHLISNKGNKGKIEIDLDKEDKPIYIKTLKIEHYIKVKRLCFDFEIHSHTENILIDGGSIIGMVLKDISNGKIRMFKKDEINIM